MSAPRPRLFISHSSQDKELVEQLVEVIIHALALPPREIVCSTIEGSRLASGATIDMTVQELIATTDSFLALLSPASVASKWVLFELGARWNREPIRMLRTPGLAVESLGLPFDLKNVADATSDAAIHRLLRDIHHDLHLGTSIAADSYATQLSAFLDTANQLKTLEESHGGIVSRAGFERSTRKLPGEVFAVELLEKPVYIQRAAGDVLTVTVDRRQVERVLISNAGKTKTVRSIVTTSHRDAIRTHDRHVQKFLAGHDKGLILTDPPDLDAASLPLRLRWASGGALSIVRRNGRQWVPLFFRDIRPYGWNISLGQTERSFDGDLERDAMRLEEELREPARYIAREFIEESLVVSDDPRKHTRLKLRRFHLRNLEGPVVSDGRHDHEHLRLRLEADGLHIEPPHDMRDGKEVHDITAKVAPWSRLRVVHDDNQSELTDHVLICFSLLDLGIEVVKVFEYDLDKPETMLDGEILEVRDSATGESKRELVRMPIALMSLDYLRRTFTNPKDHRYTEGPQPSIQIPMNAVPGPEDIELFPHDVRRRMEILRSGNGTESEQQRFLRWYDTFRDYFIDAKGEPSCAKPSPLFVPGAAKILNLYFNATRRVTATAPSPDSRR